MVRSPWLKPIPSIEAGRLGAPLEARPLPLPESIPESCVAPGVPGPLAPQERGYAMRRSPEK
jgi:hypothetical protein